MQKIAYMFILLLSILAACENSEPKINGPTITQVEAESIVMQHLTEFSNKDKGKIKIKSVSKSLGKYIVEWEIDEYCEFGTVQVDDKNGDLLEAEETNC